MAEELNPFQGTFDTLEGLADQIGIVLSCPITIEDAQHRLLAYSSHQQNLTDEARLATIIGRRVPSTVIEQLWDAGILQALNQTEEPIQISPMTAVGLGHRVAVSIRKGTDVLGYIWAITRHAFTDEQLRYLKLAAAAGSTKLLQLRARGLKEQERQQEFFWQLLTNQIRSHEQGVDKARQVNVHAAPELCVAIFQFDDFIRPKTADQMMYLITMHTPVRALLHVLDQTQLVLLLGPQGTKPLLEASCIHFLHTIMEQMKERFQTPSINGVCGSVTRSFTGVQKSYQEALLVLKLKRLLPAEMTHIDNHQNLGFFRFLPTMMEQKRKEDYVYPALYELRQYDLRYHTELIITLDAYLTHHQSVKEAAEALHIHVNTMLYRLKRISEVGNVDLDSTSQQVSLYLELLLEKLLR